MKNFAITGVAGYIAPRHLQAIEKTGNRLVAALDPHDSVGVLDRFSLDCHFYTEFERFDRFLDKLKRTNDPKKIDYLSICSPNYLHESHIRLAFRSGADAICEKPTVLKPSNLDLIADLEREYNKKVYNVLQLRLHPKIVELRNKYFGDKKNKHNIILTYITGRGDWYKHSWKGNNSKSGGLVTNIGIHFFDMLIWIFGKPVESKVYINNESKSSGFLELENANVQWFLSIDMEDLPLIAKNKHQTTYRSITINDEEVEFSDGFNDLHTEIYQNILDGHGFEIGEARSSIEVVYNIRKMKHTIKDDFIHPYLKELTKLD